uniref:Iodothyronine deiodinase n=1 Tax=Chrysemys picta bellii TaxID=8478 RepID=A0A8C3I6U9_CHRPI
MGLLSVDLLIALQILPVFFSNCLFLALYDSVILLKHMVLLLSRSKAARGEWRRMLTSEGLRCVWNSFLLDAYKQVGRWEGDGEEAGGSARCPHPKCRPHSSHWLQGQRLQMGQRAEPPGCASV